MDFFHLLPSSITKYTTLYRKHFSAIYTCNTTYIFNVFVQLPSYGSIWCLYIVHYFSRETNVPDDEASQEGSTVSEDEQSEQDDARLVNDTRLLNIFNSPVERTVLAKVPSCHSRRSYETCLVHQSLAGSTSCARQISKTSYLIDCW